ncbi:MAG: imidazole glycerol phosphate synthase subunit HisH [Alphaproteobacteria bacterium]|nr:imidazole glycerol phosphate synthase subunit HisH [Alphaproteobacteria bacterium]
MITVLNYGGGNLKSVENVLNKINAPFKTTDKASDIEQAEAILFPGQGHFGQVMANLTEKKLDIALKTALNKGIPFLGICVGLQVLFDSSDEAPGIAGLSIFKGTCHKFTTGKIPQIGWNKITTTKSNSFLTDDFYYFVNSFHVVPEHPEIVSATANYHVDFTASVQHKNIFATQFHLEKSGQIGQDVILKWMNQK